MSKVYLSKTQFCKTKQCNKIFWLDKYKPEEAKIVEKNLKKMIINKMDVIRNGYNFYYFLEGEKNEPIY